MAQKTTGTIKPDWGIVLSDKGLIVSLEIRWFKGMRRLVAEDLGLEDAAQDERFKKLFQLGQKNLLPKAIFSKLHNIETRTRSTLVKLSFETPFGQFVPYAAYPDLEKKFEQLEEDFWEALKDLKDNLNKYKNEVLADYRIVAAQVFTNGNRQEATERLLKAVEKNMPHKDDLAQYFSFSWMPFHLQTPKELMEMEKKAEGQAIKFKINQKLAKEYEKKSTAAIDSFVKDSIKKMRGPVNELVGAALKSIKKNDGVLVPRLSVTLKQMVEQFRTMNCFGDDEIEKKLVELKTFISDTDSVGPERSSQVQELLQELKKDLRDKSLFIRSTRKDVEL